jgi:cyclopropane-fatty-acyl-phospholipid synthase
VRSGRLVLIDADGGRHTFGAARGPMATVRLRDHGPWLRLLVDPGRALFEAYVSGSLTVEAGGLYELVAFCARNFGTSTPANLWQLRERLLHAQSRVNGPQDDFGGPRRPMPREFSERFSRLFLDDGMVHSSAYFVDPHDCLKDAQENKRRHVSSKLRLEPGLEVLEIGSGWGNLSLALATHFGVQVLGLTNSRAQLDHSRRRVREAGLSHRVRFELSDYQNIRGRFDRVIAVEAAGVPGPRTYAAALHQIRDLLTEDGIALVEGLGCMGPGRRRTIVPLRWRRPEFHVPSLSEVIAEVERERLFCMDLEVLRFHYAVTHRHWRQRFEEREDEATRLYGEAFCRLWHLYLLASEIGFREEKQIVFQLQLSRRADALPATRDYMFEDERGLEVAPPMQAVKQRLRLLDGPISR